jgi:selenium metabolism protein YedF
MESIIVDARGELCPKPLIMTKKQLHETRIGGKFVILIDNETSKENVERFLRDNRIQFQTTREKNIFSLEVTKTEADLRRPAAEEYCLPATGAKAGTGHAYCFTGDQMGSGPAELGQILVQGCINTIKEVEPLPAALVFYNSGVTLTVDTSPVLDALRNLEESGVRILVCGTCANYFQIKDQIRVGIISNMYTILETLSHAGHVIYP